MLSSFKLALAVSALLRQVLASPILTDSPTPTLAAPLSVETIPIAQCLTSIECCQQTFDVPSLPTDNLTSILPSGLPALPSGLPSLGPMLGFECSSASDLSIIGNQCLLGGTPVCCSTVLPGGIAAMGCQPVINSVLPTIPGLPTTLPITIPGLPTSLPLTLPGLPTAISIPAFSSLSLPFSLAAGDDSTSLPISLPTSLPSILPTSIIPTILPTSLPTGLPTTSSSSSDPSLPTSLPTSFPTTLPTSLPISVPTSLPISF